MFGEVRMNIRTCGGAIETSYSQLASSFFFKMIRPLHVNVLCSMLFTNYIIFGGRKIRDDVNVS